MKAARIKAFTTPMMEVLAAFGIAGVVWYGGYSVIAGGRTPGSFLAFLTAMFLLYDPFKGLDQDQRDVQQGVAAASASSSCSTSRADVVDRPDARPLCGAFARASSSRT